MESFVLAETLKYLLLLFADARALPSFFVLTTEGHLLAPFPAPGDAAHFGADGSAASTAAAAAAASAAEAQAAGEQDVLLGAGGPSGAVCPVPCAHPRPRVEKKQLVFVDLLQAHTRASRLLVSTCGFAYFREGLLPARHTTAMLMPPWTKVSSVRPCMAQDPCCNQNAGQPVWWGTACSEACCIRLTAMLTLLCQR